MPMISDLRMGHSPTGTFTPAAICTAFLLPNAGLLLSHEADIPLFSSLGVPSAGRDREFFFFPDYKKAHFLPCESSKDAMF